MARRNAFYAQSGGVTATINATACGVIETARQHKDRIGKVYAGRDGIIGALTEDLIDTSKESAAAIRALRHTPSGAFSPSVDSFRRVVFVRWDHLQRDQEADIDIAAIAAGGRVHAVDHVRVVERPRPVEADRLRPLGRVDHDRGADTGGAQGAAQVIIYNAAEGALEQGINRGLERLFGPAGAAPQPGTTLK